MGSEMCIRDSVDVIDYTAEAMEEIADDVIRLSVEERLPAHGEAVRARFAGTGEGDL